MVYCLIVYLPQLKFKIMKNLNLFLFAAGAALLTACGGAEEAATEPVVANYTLDAAASTLEWKGYKKGNETGIKKHVGTECVWIPSSLHSTPLLPPILVPNPMQGPSSIALFLLQCPK